MAAASDLKVLLIEDDDAHAKIISRHLKQLDDETVNLTRATTLNQGLQRLLGEPFQVVLLDLRLPDSDIGETLYNTIEKCPDVPIIVLSSIEDKKLARKMVQEGAQDYLCKADLSRELLVRAIYYSMERKRNEAALKESETRKAKIIESSLDCIITMDEDGNVIEFNSAAEKTFGYRREEIVGKSLAEHIIPPRLREQHHNGLIRLKNSGTGPILGKRIELSGMKKDGSEFPVEISVTFLKLSGHYIFTGFLRDITEQKKSADELRAAKEAAEAANHAKSSFLANMSHEIRTPLGAVLGFSELLISPEIKESDKANFTAAIKRNGELLSKIINDILDLSKVEAGKMETDIKEVALSEILSDTQTLLEVQAVNKGISLHFSYGDAIPSIIRTDPLRLKQILLNIVGNAIKFTEKGSVQVRISMVTDSRQRQKLSFVVKDSGKGIAKDDIIKLFAPFSQVDISTKRKFGGTGLGLILSRHLANLLGGEVELTKSEVGKGSTFTITIDPGGVAASQFKQLDRDAQSPPDLRHRLDGIRVLLADDSSDNQILVSKILRMAGATVEVVANGREAVEKARKEKYDVLLMDLQMPIMDGYEATAELRKIGFQTPIVALTAHALIEEKQRCLASGFDDHISKPVDRSLLLERVAHFSKTT